MIKLNSLYVDGFKNLKKCHLNFPPEGNILITGRNESGKSSLFEAIFFSLTSKLLVRKNLGYIDAIAHDKESATIDLIFQKDDNPSRIRKKIYKTGSGTTVDIEFWQDYENENENPLVGKTTELDPIIEKFLGFDDQILLNSAFVKQKGLEGFMDETRQDRIDILNKLLNLEKIPVIRENFKGELKDIEVIEHFIRNLHIIDTNKEEIANIKEDVRKYDKILRSYNVVNEKVKKLNALITETKQLEKRSENKEKEKNILKNKRDETKQKLEKVNEYQRKINRLEEIKKSIEVLNKEKEKILIEYKSLEEKVQKIKADIEEFNKKVKSRKKIEELLKKNLKEKLKKFENWNGFLKESKELKNKIETQQFKIKTFNEKIQEKILECKKLRNKIRDKIVSTLNQFDYNIKSWREIKEEKATLSGELNKYSNLKSSFSKIKEFREKEKDLEHNIELKRQELRSIEKKIEERYEKKKKVEDINDKINIRINKKSDVENDLKIIKRKKKNYNNYNIRKNKIYDKIDEIHALNRKLEWIEGIIEKNKERFESLKEKKQLVEEINRKREKFLDTKSSFFKFFIIYVALIISAILGSILINPMFIVGVVLISVILIGHFLKEKGYLHSSEFDDFSKDIYLEIKKEVDDYESDKNEILTKIDTLTSQKRDLENSLNEYNLTESPENINKKIKKLEKENIKLSEQIKSFHENKDNLLKSLEESEYRDLEGNYKTKKQEVQSLIENKEKFSRKRNEIIDKNNLMGFEEKELINKMEELKNKIHDYNSKIERISNECRNIVKLLGVPEDSQKLEAFQFIKNKKLMNIRKLCSGGIDWRNQAIFEELQDILLIRKDMNELVEFINKIKDLREKRREVDEELKDLGEKKESIREKVPESYYSDYNQFERDFNELKEKVSKTKQKVEDLDNYFKMNKKEELIKEKTEIKGSLKEKKKEIELTNKKINEKEELGESIKEKIPQEFRKEDPNKIKLNLEDKLQDFEKKMSSVASENETNWRNLIKNASEYIGISVKDLEKEDLIKKLNRQNKKELQQIKELKQKIHNKFPKINSNFSIEQIRKKLDQLQNKIGGLEKEINNAREANLKTQNHRRKAKIIEKFEEKHKNSTPEYKEILRKRVILQKTVEILDEAQTNILKKVLPKTEENLTKILPILTLDRYKDAHITEDYQIQLFDSKMGDYVEKTLFSGGTNDQIALAIRLSFAMVTMPKDEYDESFIFLDEPLGFFDDERKSALIDFLTHGVIADIFAQRIVISNFLDIKKYFDYVVELENGRIIEEYSTGTLDSSQIPVEYDMEDEVDIVSLQQEKFYEDNNFYDIELSIKNNSDHNFKLVQLEVPNLRTDLHPKFIYDLQSRKKKKVNLGITQYIIDTKDIYFNIIIELDGNEQQKNQIYKKQTIHYVPNLSS